MLRVDYHYCKYRYRIMHNNRGLMFKKIYHMPMDLFNFSQRICKLPLLYHHTYIIFNYTGSTKYETENPHLIGLELLETSHIVRYPDEFSLSKSF